MNVSKQYLETEYLIRHKPIVKIAKEHGVSKYMIRALLVENKIPIRTKYDIGAHELEGKRIGKLVVERRAKKDEIDSKSGGTYWVCKCDCGNTRILKGTSLANKLTKSCGCIWKRAKYEEMPGAYLGRIRLNAKRRSFEFSITPKYLWKLFIKQQRKCKLSGIDIMFSNVRGQQTASLDRIDSTKGYVEGNVWWVHKNVNQMKMDMSLDDFLWWVKEVHLYTQIN